MVSADSVHLHIDPYANHLICICVNMAVVWWQFSPPPYPYMLLTMLTLSPVNLIDSLTWVSNVNPSQSNQLTLNPLWATSISDWSQPTELRSIKWITWTYWNVIWLIDYRRSRNNRNWLWSMINEWYQMGYNSIVNSVNVIITKLPQSIQHLLVSFWRLYHLFCCRLRQPRS